MGNSDIDDSLQKLDKLIQEEEQMAKAVQLKVTRSIDEKVTDVGNKAQSIGDDVKDIYNKVRDVDDKLDQFNRS